MVAIKTIIAKKDDDYIKALYAQSVVVTSNSLIEREIFIEINRI
jgi:hypothetical protein